MFDDTDRGQVGIGTLIVFIALVLVAAIAAGVLINTADLLQSQAQQTGEESTDQVSNNLNIESVTGLDDASDGTINQLEFVVASGSGSDAIDITQLEIQFITDTQSLVLEHDSNDGSSGTSYFTSSVVSGSGANTLGSDERVKLTVDAVVSDPGAGSDASDLDSLGPGATAQVTFTTADGTQTVEQIQVPDIINSPEDL